VSLREEKKQQARQDILNAARDLIDQHGYDQAKMRDIAAAAHLSYQTLYNYFPTKALILQALLLDDVVHVAEQMDELISAYQSGRAELLVTLHAMNRARLDVVSQRDRGLWRVVATDLIDQQREATHIYQLIDSAAHEKLTSLLDGAQANGKLNPTANTALLADTLVALSQYTVSRFIMEPATAKTTLLDALQAQSALLVVPYMKAEV
jgi:AcrR family transcriptional regulator